MEYNRLPRALVSNGRGIPVWHLSRQHPGLLKAGLLLPVLANAGFLAPFVGGWFSWLFTLSVLAGLTYACLKMIRWPRWIAVMALTVGMHGHSLYLVSQAAI